MSLSGVLGRGSYRSVIANSSGKKGLPRNQPGTETFHACANEMIALNQAHAEVTKLFYVRDRIFDNKSPALAFANGIFKFAPQRRQIFHAQDLTQAIRRRSFWMMRIQRQRAINQALEEQASARGIPQPSSQLKSADADAYFRPKEHKTSVPWTDFWHHPSRQHLVPKPHWERHPELKGITRVHNPVRAQANDF